MTDILPSYVRGRLVDARRDDADATDGARRRRPASPSRASAPRASTSARALDYARTVGQASLGALTFHQRAVLLKQIALALTERKEELYALSSAHRRDARDSWVDIDGGIGVLFTYSSKGRRELPNAQVYVDGPVEPLSKDGSFLGRHIYTRLPGVAVQINAFNFPVWGSLEKFAPAFLAGHADARQAGDPDRVPRRGVVRILVESGLLPDGSLQLVCGSVPTLFDHLRLGDIVGFTGSASTAERLRAHDVACRPAACASRARPTRSTRRCSARTRSPGTPEFDAYVRQLVDRADLEGGAEVHRDPAGDRADGIRRRRDRRRARAHRASASWSATRAPRASRWARSPRPAQRDEVLRAGRASSSAAGGELVIGSTRRARGRRAPTARSALAPTARSSRRSCCDSRMPRPTPCTRSRRSAR